ncbi:GNAT family N-acetyltransferase [Anaerolineales bacterium HSG6]|nr:GNAT family N-acetyltransferase [Anaerolineales bacterium HSG6]
MDLKVVRTLPKEIWRDFIDKHDQSNIFHTPEMFDVFKNTEGHTPMLWAAVDKTGVPLALFLPVYVTLKDGLLQWLTTRAVVYGGILCHSNQRGIDALGLLLQNYRNEAKKNILFTEIRNLSDATELQTVLQKHIFTYEDHLNYLINLNTSQDELWQQMRKSGKKSVKVARKKNVAIEEMTTLEQLDIAYSIILETYNRLHVPLASVNLFRNVFELLSPKGMCRFLLIKVDNQYAGARLTLTYKHRIIAWYATTKREFSSCRPNEFSVWNMLEWGQENDYHLFDFGGAGKPNEPYGPRDFKAKFGGDLVNYGRNVCVHHPHLLKMSKAGFEITRRFYF